MFKTKLKNLSIVAITIILTLGFSVSLQSLLAGWSAPIAEAPASNTDAPLNVGNIGQSKNSGLIINAGSISENGLIVQSGKVGIGTTAPEVALDVIGKIKMRNSTQGSDSGNTIATKDYVDSKFGSSNPTADLPACTGIDKLLRYDGTRFTCQSIAPYLSCYAKMATDITHSTCDPGEVAMWSVLMPEWSNYITWDSNSLGQSLTNHWVIKADPPGYVPYYQENAIYKDDVKVAFAQLWGQGSTHHPTSGAICCIPRLAQ